MAKKVSESEVVEIRPGVQILSMLSRLNYRPWYAISEFVDNSLQSFLDNKTKIKSLDGKETKLKVKIKYDHNTKTLTIKDNAAGISQKDFKRAFRAAEAPPDNSGFHEFGMGMKSAACWFSPLWRVESKALGENFARTIEFDMKKIVNDSIEELSTDQRRSSLDAHYTIIEVTNLYRPLAGQTIAKIRRHLAGIYREYLRNGTLEINFDGDLSYEEPNILNAPKHDDLKGKKTLWKVEFEHQLTKKKKISGFVAIREKGSAAEAGLSLFRKKRLIQGGFDEPWKPSKIFGAPNTFMSQRIFGEIHLDGFEVSHTKDGFLMEDDEDEIIEIIHKNITKPNFNLIDQTLYHRIQSDPEEIKPRAERALQRIEKKWNQKSFKETVQKQQASSTVKPLNSKKKTEKKGVTKTTYRIEFRSEPWEIEVILSYDRNVRDLFEITDDKFVKNRPRHIEITLYAYHTFFVDHIGKDQNSLETMFKVAIAMCIAEITARDAGVQKSSLVRTNFNEIISKGWENG